MSTAHLIREPEELSAFMASISDAPFIALDTETSGLDPHTEKLLLIQFGTADKQALVDAEAVDAHLVKQIFDDERIVVMHNASFDIKMLMGAYGPELELEKARIADTQAAERLLRNGRKSSVVMPGYALKTLAERYAGMELDKSIRQGFYGIQSVKELSDAELHYAERDVEATWKVFAEQLPMLERDGLMRVAAIEGAACTPFAQMEFYGAPIDKEAWQHLLDQARTNSAEARKALDREFWTVADRDLFGGTTLNYADDAEVLDALRKLGVDARTTRKEALLATGHSAARAVAEYREHQKIVSSYGDTFLQYVHKKTGADPPALQADGRDHGSGVLFGAQPAEHPGALRVSGLLQGASGSEADHGGLSRRRAADHRGGLEGPGLHPHPGQGTRSARGGRLQASLESW